MLVLALDLASTVGFALGDQRGVRVSGSRHLPRTGDDLGAFALAFEEWLERGLRRHCPGHVVYEQPILPTKTSPMTVRKLGGLCWETEKMCKKAGIPVGEVNMSDWRKHFLGAGNVPRHRDEVKKAVMQMCRVRGFKFESDDEAEAIAILDYALACQNPNAAIKATPLFAPQTLKTARQAAAEIKAKAAGLRRA